MDQFIFDTGILLGLLVILVVLKLLRIRASLFIAISGFVFFAVEFLMILSNDEFNIIPIIYTLVCGSYIIAGGKKLAYKTQTGVFDEITGQPVAVMKTGTGWADPLFEKTTISVDGPKNISADLQQVKILIESTPAMQTKARGIQAKVKEIVFMLKFIETGNDLENMKKLFDIEGGIVTIQKRVFLSTLEFFLDRVGQLLPVKLDTDKCDTLRQLGIDLKVWINNFCHDNNYPYEIPLSSTVTIGDTELDAAYYAVLARKTYEVLEQNAQDVTARRLRKRLIETGKQLLPNGSESEQLAAAKIALGITPKTIQDKKITLDGDLLRAMQDIASILRRP